MLCVEINPSAETAFWASVARLCSAPGIQASGLHDSSSSGREFDPMQDWLPSRSSPSGRQSVGFQTADVGQQPEQWIPGSDVIIVDPPRKGLGAELLAALCLPLLQIPHKGRAAGARTLQARNGAGSDRAVRPRIMRQDTGAGKGAQRLLYLSCGFEALVKDLDALTQSGQWKVTHAQGYVFFPGTNSIETLVVLDRVKSYW